MPTDQLLYLSEAAVTALCAPLDPVAIVEAAFRQIADGTAGIAAETALRWTAPDGTAARSLVLPARHADTYGCKIINACIGNPDRGLPRASGLILLHDHTTAAPMCIMDAGVISAVRTAAVSAAAVRALRDPTAIRTITFLGCGRQATAHLELLADLCPNLEQVTAFDTNPARAEHFATHHRTRTPVHIAAGAEPAVRASCLIVAVTTTTTPYVELDWLEPGATFLNVSLDDATEGLLTGCDHLIVDDWALVTSDHQRLLGQLARAGTIAGPAEPAAAGVRQIAAELPTVLTGHYPRTVDASDRVVINPFGMGVHDIAIAAHIYSAALRSGAGTHLQR